MKPLLCSASVVRNFLNSEVGSWPARAIDSSKPMQWQDRRPIKPQPARAFGVGVFCYKDCVCSSADRLSKYSPVKVGDVLYVREAVWTPPFISDRMMREGADTWPECFYAASMDIINDVTWAKSMKWKSRPSIHMPKWASRIHLEVMRVRVERACDISEEDAIAEGKTTPFAVDEFQSLWESLYSPAAWEKFVWVYDLKRIK